MNDKWKEIVDLAMDAIPEEVANEEAGLATAMRNAVLFTVVECAKVCEAVQLKESGVTILGKHKQMQFVKALKEHFGLEGMQ
ncbi:MAG: hypothetical protein B7X61_15760 [Gallionellales bacterium 39-52-133]|jgi:hypothetical protein|nr:MAG: hypothetical protein B7X61_15760 [Gallionellales bacterium 39-52-133]